MSEMTSPMLTIVVPTYNRAGSLELLLRTLRHEIQGLEQDVRIIVSDNASTDRTRLLLSDMLVEWPTLHVRRNETNLGADGNFLACIKEVSSRYCWFISDDDLPKPGVVQRVFALLKEIRPKLVYLQSEWVAPLTSNTQGEPVPHITAHVMDGLSFVKRVHTWLTFISGVIFDRQALEEALEGEPIDRFTGTSLVQLGWILPLARLKSGRFVIVSQRCILATKGNTGGYPLLTVFGTRLTEIARAALGNDSPLARALVRGNLLGYLPLLIWAARTSSIGRHDAENPWPALRRSLHGHPVYWILLVPLGRFPRWAAFLAFQLWRVYFRVVRALQQWLHPRGQFVRHF